MEFDTHSVRWNSMNKQALVTAALGASILFGCAAAAAAPARATATRTAAHDRDCRAVYGGRADSCERIPCSTLYRSFLGSWSGPFRSYVRSRSTATKNAYRPYHETVVYRAADCLRNGATGDTMIVGHQTDSYPAYKGLPGKVSRSLLITGERSDGAPFLRLTMQHRTYNYMLRYEDKPAKLDVWKLHLPAAKGRPPMTFTTVDGQDFMARRQTRYVTVTLTVGPRSKPFWQGVIAYGSHTKR